MTRDAATARRWCCSTSSARAPIPTKAARSAWRSSITSARAGRARHRDDALRRAEVVRLGDAGRGRRGVRLRRRRPSRRPTACSTARRARAWPSRWPSGSGCPRDCRRRARFAARDATRSSPSISRASTASCRRSSTSGGERAGSAAGGRRGASHDARRALRQREDGAQRLEDTMQQLARDARRDSDAVAGGADARRRRSTEEDGRVRRAVPRPRASGLRRCRRARRVDGSRGLRRRREAAPATARPALAAADAPAEPARRRHRVRLAARHRRRWCSSLHGATPR